MWGLVCAWFCWVFISAFVKGDGVLMATVWDLFMGLDVWTLWWLLTVAAFGTPSYKAYSYSCLRVVKPAFDNCLHFFPGERNLAGASRVPSLAAPPGCHSLPPGQVIPCCPLLCFHSLPLLSGVSAMFPCCHRRTPPLKRVISAPTPVPAQARRFPVVPWVPVCVTVLALNPLTGLRGFSH